MLERLDNLKQSVTAVFGRFLLSLMQLLINEGLPTRELMLFGLLAAELCFAMELQLAKITLSLSLTCRLGRAIKVGGRFLASSLFPDTIHVEGLLLPLLREMLDKC